MGAFRPLRLRAALILLLFLAGPSASFAGGPSGPPLWQVRHLAADVELVPAESLIRVRLEASLDHAGGPDGYLELHLNRALRILSAEVNGAEVSWQVESDQEPFPFAPEARRIGIPAPAGIDEVRLSLRYEGRLPSGPEALARISPGLTELNLYGAWLPILAGPQGFDYELDVSLPAGQRLYGAGRISADEARSALARPGGKTDAGRGGEGDSAPWRYRVTGRSSAGDVPIVAGSGFESVPVPDTRLCDLEIVAKSLSGVAADRVASEIARACDFLAAEAGREPGEKTTVSVVIVPREDSGYARPPLIVLPAGWFSDLGGLTVLTGSQKSEWRRRLFHEMSHLFAPLAETGSHHDWINEGLAEFLALRALAFVRGKPAMDAYVRRYILELAARPPAPPVRSVRRDRPAGVVPEEPPGQGRPQAETPGATAGESPMPAPEETGLQPEPGAGSVKLAAISVTRRSDPDAALLYYRKGALIFRLLHGLLGEERFTRLVLSLSDRFPPGGTGRLTTGRLIDALAVETGESFRWLHADWVDGTGFPRVEGDLRLARSAGRIEGDLLQGPGRSFRSPVPIAIRGEGREEVAWIPLRGERRSVELQLSFSADEVLLDPERLLPRLDGGVEEAVRLHGRAERAMRLAREGMREERQERYRSALERYDEAAALNPGEAFFQYRRGRVYARLGRPEEAVASHRKSIRIGEAALKKRRRVERRCGRPIPMACPEPEAWLAPPQDLRAWNRIRIGEMMEERQRTHSARRSYRKALELPDSLGAHEEARRLLSLAGTGCGNPVKTPTE